jgi:hypothetical protein
MARKQASPARALVAQSVAAASPSAEKVKPGVQLKLFAFAHLRKFPSKDLAASSQRFLA